MKHKLIYSCLILLVIAALASCHNSIQSNLSISDQYFPNKVGDSWTYAVTDTAYSQRRNTLTTGTLKVSIIDSTKLPDGTIASVWRTVWPPEVSPARPPWNVDTTYVAVSGDSVLISDGLVYSSVCKCKKPQVVSVYILPFYSVNEWHLGPDSSRVISEDTLSVSAGTFDKVYHISTHGISFNYYLTQDDWFKPGVGLVQKMVSSNGLYYTWKLIDYHVK
ncbi:MAG TPA: hypothetical protein VKA34_23640 [Balneolales bacterium]|nr:hypothetical protein [Balneolales bacterium]